jgi:hypothetical protein
MLVLIVAYSAIITFMPSMSPRSTVILHFVHALAWVLIHYLGLGSLLRAQSKNKFLVRHYLKNYHYSDRDTAQGPIIEAFSNWKTIYNLSMVMTYGVFKLPGTSRLYIHCSILQFLVSEWSGSLIHYQVTGESEMNCCSIPWVLYVIPSSFAPRSVRKS